MFVLFEEAGKFSAGRVLSQTEGSCQIELDSGKRVKLKTAQVLLQFEHPNPSDLLAAAQALSCQIDLDLAWQCVGEAEFGFADLACEYFGDTPNTTQHIAALLGLFAAPHYFRRLGKGRFKKASADLVQQALAALEKKAAITAQINTWTEELIQGQCPDALRQQLYSLLFKPDKNSPEYKAVLQACRATELAPLNLFQKAGAISSAYQLHWQRFLLENFPQGRHEMQVTLPALPSLPSLPQAATPAFSIDDSSTTEIDDALSVQGLGSGTVTLGIHIAAPALSLQAGDAIDALARERLSSVYMPGNKIAMLPDAVIQAHSLQAGRYCPAVSLYLRLDETTLAIQSHHTHIEQVHIADNLRYDQIPGVENEPAFLLANIPWAAELRFLYRLAQYLKAQRETVRGKPETFNRPDFNFKLDTAPDQEPQGQERVSIIPRRRGAPLDLIVAEAMILANSTWGQWLAEHGVPGIYRSQASLAAGVKVRMGTQSLPHAGLGVTSYAWCTSPLRRYTDLVNQWQIVACVQHGATAALVAPFKPKDVELLGLIGAFDAAHSAYNAFQASMERYWTLKYLEQNQINELDAVVLKDQLVRAENLPLVLPATGTQNLAGGTRVRVQLSAIDLLALEVTGVVTESLQALPQEELS